MTVVKKSSWHGLPSLALENAAIRAEIVPELGAKIVSLVDKAHQREWLVSPMRPVKQTSYGDTFVNQDMCGWDEMMPTINACDYQGAHLPDHGEVWSIPWTVEEHPDQLVGWVEGVAWPYRFERSIALVDQNCLALRYTLTQSGTVPFPYMWAAHPQFAAGPNTRVALPPEVTRVVNVIADDPDWGKEGELVSWPGARSAAGELRQLDRVRPVETRACRKFYVPPEQHVSWAALIDEEIGCQLRMDWQPEQIPYLGLWIDEGTWNARPVAAPEPCNAYYDSLDWAVAKGTAPLLAPGEEARWELRLTIGSLR